MSALVGVPKKLRGSAEHGACLRLQQPADNVIVQPSYRGLLLQGEQTRGSDIRRRAGKPRVPMSKRACVQSASLGDHNRDQGSSA